MSVLIHPKDSGPIDMSKGDRCINCNHVVRRKGDRVYRDKSPTRRKTRPWNTSYVLSCPYCKGGIEHRDVKTVKHLECKTVFPAFKLLYVGHKNKKTTCPYCEDPVTEETIRWYHD